MITVDLLTEKGFSLITYDDQEGKPQYYHRKFTSADEIQGLHETLGEDGVGFDYDYEGLYAVLEIAEDFSMAQYLFSEAEINTGYFTHGEIPLKFFEKILNEL